MLLLLLSSLCSRNNHISNPSEICLLSLNILFLLRCLFFSVGIMRVRGLLGTRRW